MNERPVIRKIYDEQLLTYYIAGCFQDPSAALTSEMRTELLRRMEQRRKVADLLEAGKRQRRKIRSLEFDHKNIARLMDILDRLVENYAMPIDQETELLECIEAIRKAATR